MPLKSVSEEAKELGVSRGTLYAFVRKKLIPHVKFGDRILLDHEKVIAALEIPAETGNVRLGPSVCGTKGLAKAAHSK